MLSGGAVPRFFHAGGGQGCLSWIIGRRIISGSARPIIAATACTHVDDETAAPLAWTTCTRGRTNHRNPARRCHCRESQAPRMIRDNLRVTGRDQFLILDLSGGGLN